MKFIVDHNLPPRLARLLEQHFRGTRHTLDLDFDRMPDTELWQYAKDNGFHLITKDGDHFQLSLLKGAPPKVVWVRIGNAPASSVLELIKRHLDTIEDFLNEDGPTVLALGER